ncbi:SUMF1/EgtB/PvdO family nonheme iron enzyme [Arcicella rigui]|uniref:SUMF1/EgtB/PvdO family nonheme iron enzyme n=1 Tax=Arcicella rigui TaxID=797020 RepID=A0ABU5Q813_9BACT|nr:SUMF1/EgtB/PvdO family nonheme iron enzyme [Arcicella rigui]MEA5138974.1 SUMF1/EgtB/PvdO family nonheme iron enzyme [Arcicella rigui]
MNKQIRIFIYFTLILTNLGCSLELPINRSFKQCTKTANITSVSTPLTPLDLSLNIIGNTTDIDTVVWFITKGGMEIFRSNALANSPFSLTTPTLTEDGNFTITARITDKCSDRYEITTTYSYFSPTVLNISMVQVEGGTFQMGSSSGEADEKPTHPVTLSSFSIGKYEITQAQWRAVMGTNPSGFPNCDNCPVEQVLWDEIQVFISKLNRLTGKKYRLPTEAEWEFAAIGGLLSKGYTYSGSNLIDEVAWHGANSGKKTHEVGQKNKTNELGIYDMTGNVWEWCSDWYSPYPKDPSTNPTGPSSGTVHVLRGGGWDSGLPNSRVLNREGSVQTVLRDSDYGFRLVMSQN